ncbi:MAG: endo-1,4-beta-xylanase [Asticcacaulis sp.]
MHRRALLAGAAGMGLSGIAAGAVYGDIPPLKSVTPYPLGVATKVSQLGDPLWTSLAATQFSRLTPEWEMKMEYLLQPDGSLQFDRADAIVDFARRHGMAVHGHTLIWYAEDGPYFQNLKSKPDAFLAAYAGYIAAMMKRYAGVIGGWGRGQRTGVNDGHDLRPCLWRDVLGDDYVGLALEAAHEADPGAILFMNDYNLESTPAKRARFLKLCETVLKKGAPLHGIGTQTHIGADLAPGAITAALRDIASLGLKVHVSEVDISLRVKSMGDIAQPRLNQIKLLAELVGAYDAIPAAQRYGMTFWGLRDSDSWLNGKDNRTLVPDEPLLFDGAGRPKPLAQAFVRAVG